MVAGNQMAQQAKGQANAADRFNREQADLAKQNQAKLALSPKQVAPDNFLADRARRLASLRLGFAGTMTGAGRKPSLLGEGPGKVRLGE
jgi:hypothetical protein